MTPKMVRFKRLRAVAALSLGIYWAALFVGTHLPAPVYAVQANDKVLHFGAYAGLSFLLAWALTGTWTRVWVVLASFGVVVTYGALDELSQLPIPGRHGDVLDWLADVSGAGLGLLAYFFTNIALQQVFSSATVTTTNDASLTAVQGESS